MPKTKTEAETKKVGRNTSADAKLKLARKNIDLDDSIERPVVRWRIVDIMAQYKIPSNILAAALDASPGMITGWRKSDRFVSMHGEALGEAIWALNQLAAHFRPDEYRRTGPITIADLLYFEQADEDKICAKYDELTADS